MAKFTFPGVTVGSLSHRLLRVACASPMTTAELLLRAGTGHHPTYNRYFKAMAELGFLKRAALHIDAPFGRKSQFGYTLTAAGEDLLAALEQPPGLFQRGEQKEPLTSQEAQAIHLYLKQLRAS